MRPKFRFGVLVAMAASLADVAAEKSPLSFVSPMFGSVREPWPGNETRG